LENGGPTFGVFMLQRILPHPGNGSLPVNDLRLHWLAAQTQQQNSTGEQPAGSTTRAATMPETKAVKLSNRCLLFKLFRSFCKLFSRPPAYPLREAAGDLENPVNSSCI
jgi:hypothetical protein